MYNITIFPESIHNAVYLLKLTSERLRDRKEELDVKTESGILTNITLCLIVPPSVMYLYRNNYWNTRLRLTISSAINFLWEREKVSSWLYRGKDKLWLLIYCWAIGMNVLVETRYLINWKLASSTWSDWCN